MVGSDHEYQVNGKRILGRKTKWGTIEGTGCCAAAAVGRGSWTWASPTALWVPVSRKDTGCGVHLTHTRAPELNDLVRLCSFVPRTEAGALGFPGVRHPSWDGSRAFLYTSLCSSILFRKEGGKEQSCLKDESPRCSL